MNLASLTPKNALAPTAVIWGAESTGAATPSIYTTAAIVDCVKSALATSLTALTIATGIVLPGATSGSATIQTAAVAGTDTLFQLPANNGTLGQILTTDGDGVTSWVTPSVVGGADTQVQFNDGGVLSGDADFTWNKTTNVLTLSTDLLLRRRAAANFQLGAADAAAPVAQTLSVQSVVAGTINTAGAHRYYDASQGTGTGAGGAHIWRVAPAGGSGSAQNALVNGMQLDSTGTLLVRNGIDLSTIGVSGASFRVTGTNGAYIDYGNAGHFRYVGAGGTDIASMLFNGVGSTPGVVTSSTGYFGFSSTSNTQIAADVMLRRDAANMLALRNGTNAQAFNVYNTFTDASNYERLSASWVSNVMQITTQAAGTGTLRAMEINAGTYLNLNVNGSNKFGVGSGNAICYVPLVMNAGQYIQFEEGAAPSAPAANRVAVYAEDNGSGKTRWMARFATGAAVQIAIEP